MKISRSVACTNWFAFTPQTFNLTHKCACPNACLTDSPDPTTSGVPSKLNYYSFKRFLGSDRIRLIFHNQLAMTKFGRRLRCTDYFNCYFSSSSLPVTGSKNTEMPFF